MIRRFKNSDALVKEVTLLVRLNPDCVSHIPAAVEYLATAHSVEADAPEVTTSLLLFPLIFPSYRLAGMTDDLPTPCRPVRLLARSQSSAFQVSLAYVFPSCFRLSSRLFPWYICPQHFLHVVLLVSPHHMPVPVKSSLHDLF